MFVYKDLDKNLYKMLQVLNNLFKDIILGEYNDYLDVNKVIALRLCYKNDIIVYMNMKRLENLSLIILHYFLNKRITC